MSLYYSYYKDVLRTHLILMGPEAGEEEGYQYRMIAANQIKGLVPCKLRHVNDRCFLYYDVTAKRALCNVAEKERMSAEEVKEVLYSIVEVQRHIASFLLDADRLLLSPDFIFREYGGDTYTFLYYPRTGKEETEEKQNEDTSAKELIAFLLQALKPGEVRMKRILEKLSMFSREPDFVLEETVLNTLFERETPRRKKEVRPMIPFENRTASGDLFSADELFLDEEDLYTDRDRVRSSEEEEDFFEEEEDARRPAPTRHLFLLAALFLTAGLVLELVKFLKPHGITLPSFAGGVILALLACSALLSAAGVLFTFLENRRADREEERQRMLYERERMTDTLEYARS
ncbi:MAG: hypothetical protein J5935_05565 [Lachnospiraceae bacterium]|nr:hypothetical protein [Lachnospiraceae bacterium]